MKARAIIVDDEAPARRRLVRLLAEREDVEVVSECAGGHAAVSAINRIYPDLVFLDVQMPDLDGFGVLTEIESDPMPVVVFVTAYDQYALKAFEACAVDYLLKPYDSDRFNKAVDRAMQWIGKSQSDFDERVRLLLRDVLATRDSTASDIPTSQQGPRLDRFMIKRGGRSYFVRANDVDWIESDGNYVRLHVGKQTHLVRSTIASLAQRLDPGQFVRIHRRYIANIDRVKEIQPWFGGDYIVLLDDGQKLRLSRHFREHFQSRMLGT